MKVGFPVFNICIFLICSFVLAFREGYVLFMNIPDLNLQEHLR